MRFDSIISSPFRRAIQTAEIVNNYHNLVIDINDAWREIQTNGYVDMNTWSDLFNFGKKASVENIEPLAGFFKRIEKALDELVAKHEYKTILIVSHGGVHQALYAHVNKLPLVGDIRVSPMKNCEYRIYEIYK